jgi:hypothetical protein
MRHAFLLTLLAASLSAAAPAAAPAPASPPVQPAENTVHWLRQNFAAPPAAFSTMPFLVWNGEVTEAEIDRHLQAFHDQGIRGFFIHPRYGLITEYLSQRWFDLITYTVKRARELGMQAWLYDENSFPSGFAAGHVNEQMPASWNEGQGLRSVRQTRLQPDPHKRYAAILRRSGDAWEDITARAADWTGKQGDFTLYEIAFYERTAWYAGWSYVDLIHPGVTEKFIDVTMSGYERAIGPSFGRTVPGVFSDEPNISPPDGPDTLRWTPDLFDQFKQRRGYDLVPLLPSLWTETGDWKKVRHDYFALLLDLFNERWSMPYSAYAEKQHLAWTGHYWEHEWPNPWPGPDNMAMYAWQQQPGIDLLFNQYSEQVHSQFGNARAAREVASVGSQMGRRRVFCETYGGAGWELRFEDMKRLGDWEYAHGINFMNQHLSFSTLVGSRKYDFPQSFGQHDPWWGQYHVLADYFARLSLALSSGQTRNDTLIIEPTTSAWMYAARPTSNPRLDEIGNTFQQFVNALESRQIEYDLGSEQILRHFGSNDGPRLRIRERAYSRLVLPPGLETLDASTVSLLDKFLAAGGTVLSFVDVPRLVDGAASDRVTALAAKYAARWKRLNQPEELIAAGVAALPLDHAPGGNLFHLRRKLDSGELLFLVNTSLEAPARAALIANGLSVQKLDAFTGKAEPYPWKAVAMPVANKPRLAPARVQVAFDVPPAGSLLLLVSATPAAPPQPAPQAAPETPVAPAGPLAVHRLSPNVLKLDYLDLTLAGKEDRGIYFYTAQDAIFKHYGFDGNPWLSTVQFKSEILDRDHFPHDSGFSAAFHFRLAPEVPLAGLQAVVERPWLWKVLLNGVEVQSKEGAAWIDPDFGLYPIAAAAHAGDNVLTLVAQPFTVHHELEPVYILGDFGVQAEPAGFSLVPATALTLGNWKAQQMPFFSDRVVYTRHYTLAAAQPAVVRLGEWWGSTAEIRVNGQLAGVMVNPPWEAVITPLVHDGDNTVEVIVYGSLKNVFGPHLGRITRGIVTPWNHRYPPTPRQQPPGSAYDLDGYGLQTDFSVLTRK